MKKIFQFTVDNTIDIITNSSSELFVLHGDTKGQILDLVRSVYPDFENEYTLTSLKEATNDDTETYIDWVEDRYEIDYETRRNLSKEEKQELDIQQYENHALKYKMQASEFYENWEERYNKFYWPFN